MSGEIEVRIEKLSHGVFGVARTEQGVVMIPGTAPGDLVRARVVASKADYREGEVVELLESSGDRRTPPCRHLPECGGCPWQHLRYEAQLAAKEEGLRDALGHIGHLDPGEIEVRPILGAPEWAYRHRLNLRVDGEQRLGFYRHRSHRLVEIEECLIADETVNRHLSVAREWLRGVSTAVRRVEIADAGSGHVVFVGNCEGAFRHDGGYHEAFLRRRRTVRGIVLFGRGWRHVWGKARIRVELPEGFVLETSGGFTQVSPEGNLRLVESVIELSGVAATDHVLDLFCGAGNLTLPLARRAASVTGIEVDPVGLGDARRNADAAGLANCRFVQQDAAAGVRQLVASGERFDVVVLDPPRSGAPRVLEPLAALRPRRVVYVSCNPATLARDLATLDGLGFRTRTIQPIDLFPQTYHLESVACLDF